VLINNGEKAGQVIFHVSNMTCCFSLLDFEEIPCYYYLCCLYQVFLIEVSLQTHVHIIPRSKDDNLWSSEVNENSLMSPFMLN